MKQYVTRLVFSIIHLWNVTKCLVRRWLGQHPPVPFGTSKTEIDIGDVHDQHILRVFYRYHGRPFVQDLNLVLSTRDAVAGIFLGDLEVTATYAPLLGPARNGKAFQPRPLTNLIKGTIIFADGQEINSE
jgi:hypothetical protein